MALNSEKSTTRMNSWFAFPLVILRDRQTMRIIRNSGMEHMSK